MCAVYSGMWQGTLVHYNLSIHSILLNSTELSIFFLYLFLLLPPQTHLANKPIEHSHIVCSDAFRFAWRSLGFFSVKRNQVTGKSYKFPNISTDSDQSKQTIGVKLLLQADLIFVWQSGSLALTQHVSVEVHSSVAVNPVTQSCATI